MMKQLKEEVFTPRLKKIGAILGMAFLLVCGMTSMNAVQAQTQITTSNGNTGSHNGNGNLVAFSQEFNDLEDEGIDVGSVDATIDEGMVYAKTHYDNVVLNNPLGYSDAQQSIAANFYEVMATSLDQGKGAVDVGSAITAAYVRTKGYVMQHYDASYVDFLLEITTQTVEDLQ